MADRGPPPRTPRPRSLAAPAQVGTVGSIEHVLVALDRSSASLIALDWAVWFARTTNRELTVAHAWQYGALLEDAFDGERPSDAGELEAAIEAHLGKLTLEACGDARIPFQTKALRGVPAEALTHTAVIEGAALLVVGRRGEGGRPNLRSLGSVSRQLTECPVHPVAVVPETAGAPSGGGSYLVGVDGSDHSARAVRWVGDVAARRDAAVTVVHAFKPTLSDLSRAEAQSLEDEARQRLEEEWCAPLRLRDVAHTPVLVAGDPQDVIMDAAQQTDPSAIVLGSRGLGRYAQRMLGSVTRNLLRYSDWPVIVIPGPSDCPRWDPPAP